MDDPTYTDDELEAFFGSPDARRAALDRQQDEARTRAGAVGAPERPAPLAGEDAELGAFFDSPDAPARPRHAGDGASGDGYTAPPAAPAAPPRPTGAAAVRRRRVGRALALVLGLIGLGAAMTVGVILYLSQDLPSLEQIENPRNLLATEVRTADGLELARYYDGENRTWVALDGMSDFVPRALIATEDRRFYEHWGVDAYAIGAIIKDFVTGRGARGASTITMQLARNLYREATGFRVGERSVVRKAKEILIAIRIERTYTKPEILEAYLNTVPFLYNAYGIEAASQTFFSKPSADLSANEAATLVGMLAANSRYNPCLAPGGTSAECLDADGEPLAVSQNEAAIERRNVVLANMRSQSVLSEAEYTEAREAPIRLAFDVYSHEDNIAPHFAEVLRLWFREWAEANDYDPYADGLVIHTTIDSRMQALAEEAVQEQMDRLQTIVNTNRWGTRSNPFGYWWSRNTAVVNEYIQRTQRFRDLQAQEDLGTDAAIARLRQNQTFMDSLKTERTRLEAGLIAMDPTTGRVKAWVGGRNFVLNKYDHGGQARRQPGSTFKLFAYAAAFNNGYSPRSGVFDSPFKWGDWEPKNSGNSYAGYTTLAEGLRSSRNTVAARITKHFGTNEIARTAYQMGIRTPLELGEFDESTCPPYLARKPGCYARSIALGTQDVSLLEMVSAYATVANYGVYHGPTVEERPAASDVPPHIVLAVDRIEDRYGNVVADFTPVAREVLNPSTAYTTFDAMRAVVNAGTGRGLNAFRGVGPLDVAGKTGTTQENADGWFIGMTPQLVVGSWTGFDDRRITYPSTSIGQGGRTGLRNVGAFLSKLQAEPEDSPIRLDPGAEFERPPDYQPPTRRSRIGDVGYWPGDSRRRRSRSEPGQNRQNRTAPNPARDIINRFNETDRPAAPAPPPAQGGGRIGW